MDKTVKMRAYAEEGKSDIAPSNQSKEQSNAELAKKEALLEDEKSKSLELLKTIVQLRESLKQEQAKNAGASNATVANELAVKEAQLEEEKVRSLENLKTIVHLRESLKQEQAKSAELFKITAELEAQSKIRASLDATEIANKTAQLAEEKSKVDSLAKSLDELKAQLKHEQAQSIDLAKLAAEMEAQMAELSSLMERTDRLAGALSQIAEIANSVKSN